MTMTRGARRQLARIKARQAAQAGNGDSTWFGSPVKTIAAIVRKATGRDLPAHRLRYLGTLPKHVLDGLAHRAQRDLGNWRKVLR